MGFYFAIDIGTTNIEVSLLNDKETICRQAFSNRQSLYGSDVLTRINTITRDREYLNVMSCIVKQDIFDCIINRYIIFF